MKIRSCYIAGFGKYVDRSFDFAQNPFIVLGGNGWGKTTLAAFLEAMLYGLEAGRGKAVRENPRKKYAPWSGGAFGGTVVLEYRGEEYRVERAFGRTPNADRARVYDQGGRLCYRFGERAEKLGETILGVDRESYRKTVHIPQGEIELKEGFPEGLQGRLASLLAAENDENAGGAIARLDEAERKLRAKRKPAKGLLDEIEDRLENLALALSDCENAEKEAREIEAELRETQGAGMRATPKLPKKRGLRLWLVAIVAAVVIAGVAVAAQGLAWGFGLLAVAAALLPFCREKKTRRKETDAEEIAERRGRLLARLEYAMERMKKREWLEREEAELCAEKARLERRLVAIRTAREVLLRAHVNAAAQYCQPVEAACKKYLQWLGETGAGLYLAADGSLSIEERGSRKAPDYYSEGTRGLLGFCTRLALAESVFASEPPVLILDDPFVHFDGKRLALAKRLVTELSKRWQILYFTCSEERSFLVR